MTLILDEIEIDILRLFDSVSLGNLFLSSTLFSDRPRKSSKGSGRSWVWQHFKKDSAKVHCDYCTKEFSHGTATTNLARHLEHTHRVKQSNAKINGSDEVDLEALVFSHFIPNQDKDIVKCEHCNDEFKIATSPKDLEHHLKTIHDINL